MKKTPLLLLAFMLMFLVAGIVRAANTGTVAATVTAQNVSLSLSDGTVSYGTLGNNSSANTTSGGLNDSQTVTNNGNVNEDITIKGTSSANWTLAGVTGTDQYVHEFCTEEQTCDTVPTWTALTTNYATLKAAVTPSGTYWFDLKITTPNPSTAFTSQSVDVYVMASAS